MKKTNAVNGLILAWLLGYVSAVCADDQQKQADTEQPSMELLEFLGEWETKEGDWLDFTKLDEMVETGWVVTDDEDKRDE
jgi:hypothetical protein